MGGEHTGQPLGRERARGGGAHAHALAEHDAVGVGLLRQGVEPVDRAQRGGDACVELLQRAPVRRHRVCLRSVLG